MHIPGFTEPDDEAQPLPSVREGLLVIAFLYVMGAGVLSVASSIVRCLWHLRGVGALTARALILLCAFWARDVAMAHGFSTTTHDAVAAMGCAACLYPMARHRVDMDDIVRACALAALVLLFTHGFSATAPRTGTALARI